MKLGLMVSFGSGGGDRSALNLVRAFKEKGVDFQLFYNEWSIPKKTKEHNDPDYQPPSRQAQFEAVAPLIKISSVAELNDFDLDILQTFRSGEDLWLLPGLEKQKTNFLIVENNFHGALLTRADYRVFPSQALFHKAGQIGCVIPNAIARPHSKENLRAELGLEGKFVFGRCARPDGSIHSDTAFAAYQAVAADDTAFLYVGANQAARRDAERLGLKNVVFVDFELDEVRVSKLYNTMDVHCHSNQLGETFGNTIAEASIHGVPTVSHRGYSKDWPQAHAEQFGVMLNKLYVGDDPPYTARYADIMRLLFLEPHFREMAAFYLKSQAETFYAADVIAAQYLKLYEQILEKK